jgi:hypothetical protein
LPEGQPQTCTIEGLTGGEIYYYAIKAADAQGNISSLSNVDTSFSRGVLTPTPAATAVDPPSRTVMLTANTVESYLSLFYEFALDSLIGFPSPRIDVDLSADSMANGSFDRLSAQTRYYWRCRAKANSSQDSSNWSSPVQFNISTGVLANIDISDCLYPKDGQTVNSASPVFSIRSIPELSEIYIQVADNRQFISPLESGSLSMPGSNGLNWRLTQSIETGKTYYWRASSDNAIWTTPISFRTVLAIHVYPNPFNVSSGETGVTFTNLPQESDITIATISGSKVRTIHGVGPNEWVWDVKNDSGHELAPGVYLYMVDYKEGSTSGKLVVTR